MFRVRVSAVRLIGVFMLSSMTTESISPEYHYYNQALSWSDARSFCRIKHSDLATVTSMDEARLLAQTAAGKGDAWIGLRIDGPAKWLWSDGSGEPSPTFWLKSHPNYLYGPDLCVEMTADGWRDTLCIQYLPLVCQRSQWPYYYAQSYTWEWTAGRDHCRSLGMDLPTVLEAASLESILNTVGQTSAWTGLYWDRWAWSDESPSYLRYWTVGMPAHLQGCAVVNVTDKGRWYEERCEAAMPFVCQGALKSRRVRMKLKMESDGDLDGSAASAQLLRQLEVQLRSQGVSDFKLSWKSDIHRQDEINEDPAAESHGPGPCDDEN